MAAPSDFEARMRSMIISNGVPLQASDSEPNPGNAPQVTSPTPRKRPTQAQRRQGLSNRLDLSEEPIPPAWYAVSVPSVSVEFVHSGHDQSRIPQQGNMNAGPKGDHYSMPQSPQSWRDSAAQSQSRQQFSNHTQGLPQNRRQQPGSQQGIPNFEPAQTYQGGFRSQFPQSRHDAPLDGGHEARRVSGFNHRGSASGRTLFDPRTQNNYNNDLRPPFRQADYLADIAASRLPTATMPDSVLAANESLRCDLEAKCRVALQNTAETNDIDPSTLRLECFGSIASGFATADSDMDIMLIYDSQPEKAEKYKCIPRLLERTFLNAGFGARLLTRTRVPIIRFCEKPPKELLENLRRSRDEWDEAVAKRLAEGRSADDESEEHADDDADDSNNEAADAKEGDDEAAKQVSNETPPDSKIKPKRAPPKKTPQRPPYKNDQERLQLYNLAIKEDWFDPAERKLIYAYADALVNCDGDVNGARLREARQALDSLPDVLAKYRPPRDRKQELEYPKDGVGVLCDINFSSGTNSNPLAIHNTRLLRCYSLFDDRIRQMVIFVKAWAKIRKINKPYHGTLSSYGYVLMVLHFAVNVADPPLAPNLQQSHIRNATTGYSAPTTCNEYDVRFWQDPEAIKAAAQSEFGRNQQHLGSLLAQFFRYYAVQAYKGVPGFQWTRDVLSLRTPGGLLIKQAKGWTGATEQAKDGEDGQDTVKITHRYLLAIEDPFEHAHNVGRPVMHHGIVAIRDEFRRANQLIISQGFFNNVQEDFFAEGVEKERTHRYFGPNPKHKKPPFFRPKNLVGEARTKALEKSGKLAEKEATKPVQGANSSTALTAQAMPDSKVDERPEAGSKPKKEQKIPSRAEPVSRPRLDQSKPVESPTADKSEGSPAGEDQVQKNTNEGEAKQGKFKKRPRYNRRKKEDSAKGTIGQGSGAATK